MNDLLDTAISAHGGLDRWNQVTSITVDASITGAFWALKGQGDSLNAVRFTVEAGRQRLTMDYIDQDKRSIFEPDRVVVQKRNGKVIDARDEPKSHFSATSERRPGTTCTSLTSSERHSGRT
jgi:hypothetical protein